MALVLLDPGRWDTAASDWLAEKRRQNLSAATLEQYAMCLAGARTTAWRERHGVSDVADATPQALRQLADELSGAVSVATVRIYHRVLTQFLRWCDAEGIPVAPKATALRAPKVPVRMPDAFTADDVARIRGACRNDRDKLLVDVLLATGLRAAELCALRLSDVVEGPQGAFLTVRQGKGRKDRIVPLDTATERLSRRLRLYARNVRPETSTDALFVTLERADHQDDHAPLTVAALKCIMRRLAKQSGIHVHAHRFRHTFATRALASGVDPLTLQRVLGHTTLTMTSRYVHFAPTDILRVWARVHG